MKTATNCIIMLAAAIPLMITYILAGLGELFVDLHCKLCDFVDERVDWE